MQLVKLINQHYSKAKHKLCLFIYNYIYVYCLFKLETFQITALSILELNNLAKEYCFKW